MNTCQYPLCEAKTSKDLCRHHSVKYNNCAYDGCVRRCRKVYCGIHKPELMAKRRAYNVEYKARKALKQ